ncbi:transaldolase family protein [Algicella marina]|uniref:Transaldolase n=1 Tax=Algicella marina TaxID=2683284 RepID=A0A6P1SWV1_9RHOB|nr:transaldolase family protein [Algicella marina]QHQ34237.1 transaldolase [Algicella marina]
MRLYLDTAERAAWEELMPLGIFHGITTNPLLAHRAGLEYGAIDWREMAGRARALGAQELHAQAAGPVEGYVEFTAALYEAGRAEGIETVVKVPLVPDAIRQVPAVKALGGKILMTCCYDAKQMLVAVALGADYIAPYYGRMVEAGMDADAHMARMLAISRAGGGTCRVMAASLRNPEQVTALSLAGHDVFTIAPAVARALLGDDLSAKAYAQFEAAAAGEGE